mgnify:CR=1 FL=1
MSSKTYQIGVAGCGGMGRHHLDVIKKLPDAQIAAVCDIFPEAIEKVEAEYEVGGSFTDVEEMLDSTELDMVTVATQTRGHHAPAVAILKRGISVLCEKPIAIDPKEADEMVEAAAASGAKFAINQQNHVNPGIRKAQEMVADGAVGDLVLVRGRNKAGRKSGNEFMEMGTHVTDMMICFGGLAQWVSGTVMVDDRLGERGDIMEAKEMSPRDRDSGLVIGHRVIGNYGFDRGVLGEIHFLAYSKTMAENYGVDILGTEGQLAVRTSSMAQLGSNLWQLDRPMEGTPTQKSDWKLVDFGQVDENPISTMYQSMFEAIENDTDPPSSGIEGRIALEMILGIYESHREDGRRISLPLEERRHPLEMWREIENS